MKTKLYVFVSSCGGLDPMIHTRMKTKLYVFVSSCGGLDPTIHTRMKLIILKETLQRKPT